MGFGIRDGDSAAQIAAVADAVVVGSALIQRIEQLAPGQHYDSNRLLQTTELIAEMRAAMDAVQSR